MGTEQDTVSRTGDDQAIDPDAVPAQLGRYRVVERIGAGGMGVVLAAIDPELDRTVAIKLVRPRPGTDHETAQQRLRREAQVLARLAHPNVVSIYDVVVEASQIGVVMQHVDGLDLRHWLAEAPRAHDEIMTRFLAAGRGLAAAHEAGIVHRDFKSSNVLVEHDGTVRVTDFGLARLVAPDGDLEITDDAEIKDLESTLTCGKVVGTPCYMSPEQFRGGEITPASDQFGFCASLWEALAGERPFEGRTFAELRTNITAGTLRPPPRGRIPRRVQTALRRGLSTNPADRFSGMAGLLRALAPRKRVAWASAAAAIGLVATAATVFAVTRNESAPCASAAKPVDRVWSPQRRATLSSSLAAIAHPRSADLARRTGLALDDRATRWRGAAVGACEAKQRGGQAQNILLARDRCLARSVAELDAAIAELAKVTTPQQLVHVLSIARTGEDPAGCADPHVPAGSPPTAAPALVERVAALHAAWRAGRIEEVLAKGPALAAEVDASGDPALRQDAWSVVAAAADSSSTQVARDANRRAAEAATIAGDDLAAVGAWSGVVTTAAAAGELETVDDLLAMARASAAQTSDPAAKHLIAIAEAEVAIEKREYDTAITTCRGVLDATKPTTEISEARQRAYNCLTSALERARRWDQLEAAASSLLDEITKTYGRDHPRALAAIMDLASARFMRGDKAAARALWAEADAGLGVVNGPDSLQQMKLAFNIATFEGDYDTRVTPEATAATERAMAIARTRLPVEDPQRGQVAWGYANLQVNLGNDAAAAAAYGEAAKAFSERNNPEVWARLVTTAAPIEQRLGHCAAIVPQMEHVMELHDSKTVSKVVAAVARGRRAACLGEAGRVDQAVGELARAATDAVAEGEASYAVDFELEAATLEAERGRSAVARQIATRARARITGDSDNERKQRERADALLK